MYRTIVVPCAVDSCVSYNYLCLVQYVYFVQWIYSASLLAFDVLYRTRRKKCRATSANTGRQSVMKDWLKLPRFQKLYHVTRTVFPFNLFYCCNCPFDVLEWLPFRLLFLVRKPCPPSFAICCSISLAASVPAWKDLFKAWHFEHGWGKRIQYRPFSKRPRY